MIERHTFRQLIETIAMIEAGIEKFEAAVNCHIDDNWMVNAPCRIITAIAEGFFENYTLEKEKGHHSIVDSKLKTIEELLYHFIYMEDYGNESEHCKSKLVVVDQGEDTEKALPCTCIDELYDIIQTYINDMSLNFSFNYCHSYREDKELKNES